ncbi:MAG: hypothetical protein GKR87_13140 [Kiritimatiellae bacterium]|nr:hypothetical protein [Kiritimatiellia bacterium]
MKFTTDERAEEGGAGGALLHFLMEYGLTLDQEQELKGKLKKQYNGKLMGPSPWNLPTMKVVVVAFVSFQARCQTKI